MISHGLAITSRPIAVDTPAYILVLDNKDTLVKLFLAKNRTLTITVDQSIQKRCTGWYDIATHQNHICEASRQVDAKFEACFECRKRTGFNPAFYNTEAISSVQAEYNQQPHTVYIAYFGNGIAKAGIMSDSRGLERIYEQGALLYAIVEQCPNAKRAHEIEEALIAAGLRNSVTKKQKEDALRELPDEPRLLQAFKNILQDHPLPADSTVVSNLSHFFYGHPEPDRITPITNQPISGVVAGVTGRYLVLENNQSYYGYWLDKLNGFSVTIEERIETIYGTPVQAKLF